MSGEAVAARKTRLLVRRSCQCYTFAVATQAFRLVLGLFVRRAVVAQLLPACGIGSDKWITFERLRIDFFHSTSASR